jgi:hypothetical protein
MCLDYTAASDTDEHDKGFMGREALGICKAHQLAWAGAGIIASRTFRYSSGSGIIVDALP